MDLDKRLENVQRKSKRRKLLEGPSAKDEVQMYALFSQGAYLQNPDTRSGLPQSFNLPYTYDPKNSTVNVAVYKRTAHAKNEPDIVVAFRGTSRLTDAFAHGHVLLSKLETSPRYTRMKQVVADLKKANPSQSMVLTGHSIGGGLAGAIGGATKTPSITLNPYKGVTPVDKDTHNSIQYTTNGGGNVDPLTWLTTLHTQPGETIKTINQDKLSTLLPNVSFSHPQHPNTGSH